MLKIQVEKFVRNFVSSHEEITTKGNCRNAVLLIAQEIGRNFPGVIVRYLAYPEAKVGLNVHYSLLLTQDDWQLLVNVVSDAGFPEYVGDFSESTSPFFFKMEEALEVV